MEMKKKKLIRVDIVNYYPFKNYSYSVMLSCTYKSHAVYNRLVKQVTLGRARLAFQLPRVQQVGKTINHSSSSLRRRSSKR